MTPQIGVLLLILAASLVLFSMESLAVDIVALAVLLTLIFTGLLPPDTAFAGFGSSTVLMIFGLLILTAALTRTGVVDLSGRTILRHTGTNPARLLIVIMIASATLGAFMSNTASTAFFVPVVIGLARKAKISASRLLMPLAFSSIISSSVTIISTSTNILISGLLTKYNMPPMGIFELAPVGVPISILGLLYMFFVGQRLIPDRAPDDEDTLDPGNRPYVSEVIVLPESPLIGKSLAETDLGQGLELNVLRIVRSKERYLPASPTTRLDEGDVLLVQGQRDEILKIKDTTGIDLKADVSFAESLPDEQELRLIEFIILPGSRLIGRTLKGVQFNERYGVQVLALYRRGESIRRKISQVALRMGDVLLIQGNKADIAQLEDQNVLSSLVRVEEKRLNIQRAPQAIAIFVGVLVAATFGLVALPVAVLLGALLVFITRCITPEEAYDQIEWKAVILIGCMLALGAAMEQTGTAEFLASYVVNLFGEANPLWLLTAFFVLTVILTQPMSNQAAAVVVFPVAVQTALQLGLNPRTFAMMVAVAASCSYLTPLEPSCLMVYGPGRYKFMDFFRVGAPLTILIFIIAIVLVPIVWPVAIR